MNIGSLRECVRIELPSSSAAADGEYGAPTWRAVATVRAAVTPLSARERLSAQAVQSLVSYRVALRYTTAVTPKARIVCLGPDYAGSTMQIHAVIPDRARGSLELDCSEVLA